MRTQDQNPAYQRFRHLVLPNGRYSAQHVDVFWNRDERFQIKDVEVVFIPRGDEAFPPGTEGEEEFWRQFAAYNDRWIADDGNSVMGWLEPNGPTPEKIFGYMLEIGFVSTAELRLALEEFAHIEECEWARRMLLGFERDLED